MILVILILNLKHLFRMLSESLLALDSWLITVEELIEHLHEAKQILFRYHVIVLKAIVAFKYELFHRHRLFIYKVFNILHIVTVLQYIICEREAVNPTEQSTDSFTKLGTFVLLFYVFLKCSFVNSARITFICTYHFLEVLNDFLSLLRVELKIFVNFLVATLFLLRKRSCFFLNTILRWNIISNDVDLLIDYFL